jgi:hypothetical protein
MNMNGKSVMACKEAIVAAYGGAILAIKPHYRYINLIGVYAWRD